MEEENYITKPSLKIDLFYDANCFASIPEEDLEFFISSSNNKIVSTVLEEIRNGFKKHSNNRRFKLILNEKNELQREFQIVSLEPKRKTTTAFRDTKTIYIKENPHVCSAYYTWLPFAVNPAIITDQYRHLFNNMLFEMSKKGDSIDGQWFKSETRWRKAEADQHIIVNLELGKTGLDPTWLLNTRSKRIKELKSQVIKIVDYQAVLSALLYACLKGQSVLILTSDRDLLDIHNNLMEAILETYSINQLLEAKINPVLINADKLNSEGIILSLTIEAIHAQLKKTVDQIHTGKHFSFGILYYKQDDNKVYRDINIIPLWLRDFILEYKHSIDCYSIPIVPEYKLKYCMDPTRYKDRVLFKIRLRQPVSKWFMPDCESRCIYSKAEREAPGSITGFMDNMQFDDW